MCGIIGYVGSDEVVPVILDGLRRLEYRGYDSAGMAVLGADGVEILRAEGKLRNLEQLAYQQPLHGTTGIGHTRWATHGAPTKANAHPQVDASGEIAVVHNGILENYASLRRNSWKTAWSSPRTPTPSSSPSCSAEKPVLWVNESARCCPGSSASMLWLR